MRDNQADALRATTAWLRNYQLRDDNLWEKINGRVNEGMPIYARRSWATRNEYDGTWSDVRLPGDEPNIWLEV